MPGQHSNLVIMTFEAIKFLLGFADVKYFNFLIPTTCQKPISIYRVPPHLANSVVMSCYSMNTLSTRSRVPDLDQVVFAASQNQTFNRMPVTRLHITAMVAKFKLLHACREIKDLRCAVIRARDKFNRRVAEGNVIDTRLVVSLEMIFLGTLNIAVHDFTLFIPGNNKLLKVSQSNGFHSLFAVDRV